MDTFDKNKNLFNKLFVKYFKYVKYVVLIFRDNSLLGVKCNGK